MARNPRVVVPGYAYHLTQRGTNRQDVFHSATDRRVYLALMRENLRECSLRLLAYCLMSNHVHFIAVPERTDSLSVWMRRVNGRYAQYFNARMNRTGHLWQSRFFSCALSWRHRAIGLRYVEMNPVRANLVARPEQYPWSSAAEHLCSQLPSGTMLDRAEWEDRGGNTGWSDLLGLPVEQPIVHLLRRCTYGGRPFGTEEFIREVEGKLGCHWRRWTYQQELQNQEILMELDSEESQPKPPAAKFSA